MFAFPLVNEQSPPEGIHITIALSFPPIRLFLDLPTLHHLIHILDFINSPPIISYEQDVFPSSLSHL